MRARMIVALTLVAGVAASPSAEASSIRQFRVPTAKQNPINIVAGSHNDLWYRESENDGSNSMLGRITTKGVVTEYPGLGAVGTVAVRDRDVWVAYTGGIKHLRVTYRRNRPPSVRISSKIRLPAGGGVRAMETARDGSLWYVASAARGAPDPRAVYYGRVAATGVIRELRDDDPPFLSGDVSLAITPAGEVWVSSGYGSVSVNQNFTAYLSRIGENLNVVERQVVPNDPQPRLLKETFVGRMLATNSSSLLFPLDWASESQPDTNTRLFGEMTSARQFRLSVPVIPTSVELFRGRDNTVWTRDGPVFVRLNDDGSVARRYSGVNPGWRGFIDAAQAADGRFWVTQSRSNSIGRITLTP